MYCRKCGTEISDDSIFCYKCGEKHITHSTEKITKSSTPVTKSTLNCEKNNNPQTVNNKTKSERIVKHTNSENTCEDSTTYESFDYKKGFVKGYKKHTHKYATPIIIFYIISMVFSIPLLFPLLWEIPMFLYYKDCVKENKPLGDVFVFSTLFFVNTVAGILLICDA